MWREDLEDLRNFLIAEGPTLTRWPELLWQQAANQPRSSRIAVLAEELEAAGTWPRRPWLRWVNRPEVSEPGPLLTIPAHMGEVSTITFSSDGMRIVSAGLDGTVAIWEVRNGKEVARIGGVGQAYSGGTWGATISALSSAGGGRIALAREGGTITVHRDVDGGEVARLRFGSGEVRALSLSADGARLALSTDEAISVWEVLSSRGHYYPRGMECIDGWKGGRPIQFAPDSDVLFYGSPQHIRDLPLARDRPIRCFGDWDLPEEDLQEFWDGRALLTSDPTLFAREGDANDSAHRPRVLQVSKGEDATHLPGGDTGPVVSENGRILVTLNLSAINVFDLGINEMVAVMCGGHDWDPTSVWLSPAADFLLVSGKHGELEIWNVLAGVRLHDMDTKPYKIRTLAFHPDGRQAVFCSWSAFDPFHGVRVLGLVEGQLLGVLAAHAASVTALAFSGDGNLLVSGDTDGRIVVWDFARAPVLSDAQVLPRKVSTVEVDERGKSLWYQVEAEELFFPELDNLREEAGLGWHAVDMSTGREVSETTSQIENPRTTVVGQTLSELESKSSEGPQRVAIPGLEGMQFKYDLATSAVGLFDLNTGAAVARFVLPEPLEWVGVLGDLLILGGAAKGRLYLLEIVLGDAPGDGLA